MGNRKTMVFEYLIIISLLLNEVANIVSFYLSGNTSDTVRKGISWTFMGIVWGCMVLFLVSYWVKANKKTKKTICFALVPVALTAVVLIIALATLQSKPLVLKECVSFVMYCIPVSIAALYMSLENGYKRVIEKVPNVAIVLFPFYFGALLNFATTSIYDTREVDYGGIVYLALGYSAILLYTLLICYLFIAERISRVKVAITFCEIVLFAVLAFASGSRGALVAWGAATVVALVFVYWYKRKIVIVAVVVSCLAIVVYAFGVPADNASVYRQFVIISELKEGRLLTSIQSEKSDELVDIIEQNASEGIGWNDTVVGIRDNIITVPPDKGSESTDENNTEADDTLRDAVLDVTNGSMARAYLYRLAWNEFKSSPVVGIGPMGFHNKYGSYVHNVFFEAFSDFGIIGGLIYVGACAVTIFMFVVALKKRELYAILIIMLVPQAIKCLLSGDLYNAPFILFAFAIISCEFMKGIKQKKEG